MLSRLESTSSSISDRNLERDPHGGPVDSQNEAVYAITACFDIPRGGLRALARLVILLPPLWRARLTRAYTRTRAPPSRRHPRAKAWVRPSLSAVRTERNPGDPEYVTALVLQVQPPPNERENEVTPRVPSLAYLTPQASSVSLAPGSFHLLRFGCGCGYVRTQGNDLPRFEYPITDSLSLTY